MFVSFFKIALKREDNLACADMDQSDVLLCVRAVNINTNTLMLMLIRVIDCSLLLCDLAG